MSLVFGHIGCAATEGGTTTPGATYTWRQQSFTQNADFATGLTLALTDAPVNPAAVRVDYNGRTLLYGTEFTVTGSTVTINFGDTYVTTYDTPPYFQVHYPKTV